MSKLDDEKRYYFMKLPEDFFQDVLMKKIRRLPGGDAYTIITLKILLLGLKDGNRIYYKGIEESIAKEIALYLDEDDVAVDVVIKLMLQHGWLEQENNDTLYSPKGKQMTTSIGSRGKRKAEARFLEEERNKVPLEFRNSSADIRIKNIEKEIEDIEIEKDIDIEDSLHSSSCHASTSLCDLNCDNDDEVFGQCPTSVQKEVVPYQRIVDAYNSTCITLPRCTKLSESRKKHINVCWKTHGEKMFEGFRMAQASDFLSGRSGKWRCSFDWLINANNMTKVLEGTYSRNLARSSGEDWMKQIENDPRYKGDGDITQFI